MATPTAGTNVHVANRGADEAVPVDLVAGTVDVDLGAAIGMNDSTDTQINPATSELQTTGNTALATLETTLTNLEKCLMGYAAPNVDSPGMQDAAINAATGARTQIIAAPGEGKQIWIYGMLLLCDTVDVAVTLESATTAKSGAMPQMDNGGFSVPPGSNFAMPFIKCGTNEAFNITMGTGIGDGTVTYAIITV